MRILVNLEREMARVGFDAAALATAASLEAARVGALLGGATATLAEASAINRALNLALRKKPAAGAFSHLVKRTATIDHLSSVRIRKRTRHGVKRALVVPNKRRG